MILTNRLFERKEPDRDAKSLYIFCEGKKREFQYFRYFCDLDTRINVNVYPLQGHENNSPIGLYAIAEACLVKSNENPSPKYEVLDGDEIWFVIDTDKWGDKIGELRHLVANHNSWNVAQSNPCFEVWLFFHQAEPAANFENQQDCDSWREFVANNPPGGFDSRRHPIYIGSAIAKAKASFFENLDNPEVGSTQVFRLAISLYSFCGKAIEDVLNKI